ncbi:PDZ domain-containing protein [Bernardetia sp.]|uniref:PDZ domain-containing protein n=1 Tax=Bernardetia sp. TaxID=1937974 RepID=UPI0025BBD586|nr:PDZ domain-containing protein [Bernardetia sp.]
MGLSQTLDRSPFVGAELGTLTEPVRVAYKMKVEEGIIIYKVFPNLAADKAGLQEKDVIIAVDSTHLHNLKEFKEFVQTKKGNDTLSLFFVRNDTVRNTSLILSFLPRENNFYFETMYDQIELDSQTNLRTIFTFPRRIENNEQTITQFPLVVLLNSASNQSIERELYSKNKSNYQFYDWVEKLTKDGFATLRIEKKGVGDSEGKLENWTFEDEQKSIIEALKKIRKQGVINQNQIYLVALGSSSFVALEYRKKILNSLDSIDTSSSFSKTDFQTIFIEKLPAKLQKTNYQNTDSLLTFFPPLHFFDKTYVKDILSHLQRYNTMFRDEKLFWIESEDDILRVLKELKR